MNSSIDGVLIKTESLTKKFGSLVAVDKVTYSLRKSEVAGIVGPNGAGKTTFFNLITGYYMPDEGSVFYRGEEVTKLSPQKRVEKGMMRTFQLTSTFDNLKVIDNLVLAYFRAYRKSSLASLLFSRIRSIADKKITECLETFELLSVAGREVNSLSLGEKRRLELAMALIAEPEVLLLDEPLAGLSEAEVGEVLDVLKRHAHKQTILIVEHKISKIKGLVERLTVMNDGKIIADGEYEEVIQAPQVRKSYWQLE